jgi:DNA-binding response OmpR family regulator
MSLVLIVEDEPAILRGLSDAFAREGYEVLTAADGDEGDRLARENRPDVVILDLMLPGLSGYEICRRMRAAGNQTPVLMLTARGEEADRVAGLDLGADDYVTKPFSLRELLARVRALLRRQQRTPEPPPSLHLGDVVIDFATHTARRGAEPLHLTAREFAMLRLLAESRGQPVSRERFLDVVWGYTAFPTTRTVDTHMATLRAKIEPDPEQPRWVTTVHRVGYRLE